MSVIFLCVLAVVVMFVGLIPRRPGYHRERTYREDMLHDRIQAAMNWEPGQPSRCECGGWVNSEGEHLKSITLEELMKAYKKPSCSLKETTAQQARGKE